MPPVPPPPIGHTNSRRSGDKPRSVKSSPTWHSNNERFIGKSRFINPKKHSSPFSQTALVIGAWIDCNPNCTELHFSRYYMKSTHIDPAQPAQHRPGTAPTSSRVSAGRSSSKRCSSSLHSLRARKEQGAGGDPVDAESQNRTQNEALRNRNDRQTELLWRRQA